MEIILNNNINGKIFHVSKKERQCLNRLFQEIKIIEHKIEEYNENEISYENIFLFNIFGFNG